MQNALKFEGILDERTDKEGLRQALAAVKAKGARAPLSVDLSAVTYANSRGTRLWLNFVGEASIQFKYINAPQWLVKQINLLKNYLVANSFVESFFAPYVGVRTEHTASFLLRIGKDLPVLKDYSPFKMPNRVENGVEFEPDFDPVRYFEFIGLHYTLFKENIT